jgi:isopentenyl diphosphate isomerase/L-lactate dehydrogenase-like FMN-dependent dehydrogenase
MLSRRNITWKFLSIGPSRTSLSTEASKRSDAVKPTGDVSVQKAAAERIAKSRPKSSRPGFSRSEEIADAAAKVTSGKSSWQRFVGGAVDALRPLTAAAGPIVMPVLDAPSKRRVRSAVNIDDLRVAAERRAHAMVYGYLAGGADDERALRRSVDAFNDVELRHAVLHGVGNDDLDLSTEILGTKTRMPYFLTSCAGQRMFHADGEIATARAAKKHGLAMALSQLTTSTFEDVRAAHPEGAKTLQLYVWRDKTLLKEVLDRAKACGFTSLALTADFSWVGNRERETRTGFTVPPSYSMRQCVDALRSPAWTYDYMRRMPYRYQAVPEADFPAESLVDFIAAQMKPEFDWRDAEWLCQEWGDVGPVALKGVASAKDAVRAVETGFKTVWVSNHGGRQLEDSIATFDVLPEVRASVGDDVEVVLDGGVRRGLDIVKALARGADSVAIGRAYLFGLAAGGFDGVDKALQILSRDVYLAMGLLGCRTVSELRQRAPDLLVESKRHK